MENAVEHVDVIVVGGGNAGLCAAIAASEEGARVALLERAPIQERGGNTAFSGAALRVAYSGLDDLLQLMSDLPQSQIDQTDFGEYPETEFYGDVARLGEYRADPDLTWLLATQSLETLVWMQEKGVRFIPMYGRQAFKVGERFRFWGGLTVEVSGGGQGLVDALTEQARRQGVEVLYGARATSLLHDDDGVHGVTLRQNGRSRQLRSKAVVLACGGFEANAEMRSSYLGPGWDLAKVRGTRFNTGDGIRMALDAGASPCGHWSGCHAVAWERNAPGFGDISVGDGFQKHSYPLGIMVNARGERFVDEGADFRNYTYAKYGHEILRQPGHFAWQVFDQQVVDLLRDEYRIREVTRVRADSLEELADKLEDVDRDGFLRTVEEYNRAVRTDVPFDPSVKDGRGTEGLPVRKSNWANRLEVPPYEAYAVTCGITFTFGGLRINEGAQVIDTEGEPIPGLYAAGELVGGLFFLNYPGGAGLTAGAVFGKIAGHLAAGVAVETAPRRI